MISIAREVDVKNTHISIPEAPSLIPLSQVDKTEIVAPTLSRYKIGFQLFTIVDVRQTVDKETKQLAIRQLHHHVYGDIVHALQEIYYVNQGDPRLGTTLVKNLLNKIKDAEVGK